MPIEYAEQRAVGVGAKRMADTSAILVYLVAVRAIAVRQRW